LSETAELQAKPAEAGPGRTLARLRAERKLSVVDVAQRLKFGTRQIEALEADEFDKLPGATFIRGMVRGYAKLLEIDPEPLLGSLNRRNVPGEISLDLRTKRVPFPQGGARRRGTGIYLFLSLIVIVAAAGVLYEWRVGALPWTRVSSGAPQSQPKQTKPLPALAEEAPLAETPLPVAPPPAAPVEKPAPAPVAVTAAVHAPASAPQASAQLPPQAPGGEGRIRMEFAGESWVEIKDKDGQMLMSQLNPTGSRRVVSGKAPLSLVIGNAANVRLIYNDKPVDLKPYIQIEVARLTLD
jgi:cytoskeleton protein RodZ